MSQFFDVDFAPLVALAAVLCAISVEFGARRARARRRTKQLVTANELLKRHLSEMQKFVNDPAAPVRFKEKLLDFSEFLAHEEKFLALLKEVCDSDFKRSGGESSYLKDLRQLRDKRPEWADTFASAIKSGVAAMIMRYAANDLMEATMAKVYSNPRKEGDLFATAMKKGRVERNDHNLGANAVPA